MSRRPVTDFDETRGLARFGDDPGDGVACVVCGQTCLPPGSDLQVICGFCAERMGNALETSRRVFGWPTGRLP